MKQISIKKNFLMNALLSLSNALFPLITYFYVARVLLTVGMGKVTFATSLVAWFSMFAQLGIPEYGVRAWRWLQCRDCTGKRRSTSS